MRGTGKIAFQAGVVLLALMAVNLLASCATKAPKRNNDDSVLIYGFVKGGDGTSALKTIQLQGISDTGKRVVANAKFQPSNGIYYDLNLPPGRYTVTQLVYEWGGSGTMTYYVAKKDVFFKSKADIKNGFNVSAGSVYYAGTLRIINFTKDGQRYFRVEDDNDPPESEAIDKLLKLITKGPWYDAIVAQKELL
mgnify:CR=1 FL=1